MIYITMYYYLLSSGVNPAHSLPLQGMALITTLETLDTCNAMVTGQGLVKLVATVVLASLVAKFEIRLAREVSPLNGCTDIYPCVPSGTFK
jgi:hypothetical protein